ncbi:hypothetical protein [Croceibacterium mercuriale]|uniref:hypothetical protein n=1 Tax=Croceibacterium mercuriale TaxID=1572751 RepID=UPI001269C70F|nr:hypothetical protein [Croceibacterium mercuriale]
MDRHNTRWCSDALEIACDNGEKVRTASTLESCDLKAMAHVAITDGITAKEIRGLIVATIEQRSAAGERLAGPIKWLTNDGRPYVTDDTRRFARGIGLVPEMTPVSSPPSSGMADAFSASSSATMSA